MVMSSIISEIGLLRNADPIDEKKATEFSKPMRNI